MYSLQAVLSIVVAAAFVHAFVRRDRRYLPVFVVALTTMLYTHNWALFLGAALRSTLALCCGADARGEAERTRDRQGRRCSRYGAIALLYAAVGPDAAVYQVKHTGAPWATRPTHRRALERASRSCSAGPTVGDRAAARRRQRPGHADPRAARPHDARARRADVRRDPRRVARLASSRPRSPTATSRRSSGRSILCAAVGLSHAGRLGLVVPRRSSLAFWLDPRTGELESKNNTRSVSASIATLVTTGDLVVATHPESLPLISYYMPKGVRYANVARPGRRPARVRLDRRDRAPEAHAPDADDRPAAGARCEPGQELVLVQPILRTGALAGAVDVARPPPRGPVGAPPGRRPARPPRGRRAGVRLRPAAARHPRRRLPRAVAQRAAIGAPRASQRPRCGAATLPTGCQSGCADAAAPAALGPRTNSGHGTGQHHRHAARA